MPGYVSHTVIARDVYKRINNKNISLDYMLTYSLGGDLCKYTKCRRDSHKIKQDSFIYNMCDYIKINKLNNDSMIMGVLYGHISHYIMDKVMHPLIRKVDKKCINVGVNSHILIEGYIDSHLVKNKYDIEISKYDNKSLFKGKMNKDISKMIDYVYGVTYQCKHVSKYYKFNLFLYSKIRFLYKVFGIKLLKKMVKFDKFMKCNKKIDLLNGNRKISYKLDEDKECNYCLEELYNICIEKTILYIDKVNELFMEK